MFSRKYFGSRYYARRYWGNGGTTPLVRGYVRTAHVSVPGVKTVVFTVPGVKALEVKGS